MPLRSPLLDRAARGPGRRFLTDTRDRAVHALAAVPAPLWLLIATAVALRIWLWVVYSPSVLNLNDAAVYANLAAGDLFGDATRSVGYPIFLRANWR
jgi:hypothetical protein